MDGHKAQQNQSAPHVAEDQIICDMIALLKVGKALSVSLQEILNSTNRQVEQATDGVVSHVLSIAKHTKSLNAIVETAEKEPITIQQIADAAHAKESIDSATKLITTHLQFQDRNTQMLNDKISLFQHFIECVEACERDIKDAYKTSEHTQKIEAHASQLFDNSRMGDIKDTLLQAFISQNLMVDTLDDNNVNDSDDNVQLF